MTNAPVETKVKVAGVFTYLGVAALLGILGATSEAELVSSLPDWLSAPVAAALPALITFWRAYQAKHTPRRDPAANADRI